MNRRPPRSTRTDTLFPYPTLFRSLARRRLALPRPTKKLTDPLWTDAGFLLALERFGYDVTDGFAATVAFQRRFRPELIDGTIARSEERRVGTECARPCRSRWSPSHSIEHVYPTIYHISVKS